jgi:hypothetical protein
VVEDWLEDNLVLNIQVVRNSIEVDELQTVRNDDLMQSCSHGAKSIGLPIDGVDSSLDTCCMLDYTGIRKDMDLLLTCPGQVCSMAAGNHQW